VQKVHDGQPLRQIQGGGRATSTSRPLAVSAAQDHRHRRILQSAGLLAVVLALLALLASACTSASQPVRSPARAAPSIIDYRPPRFVDMPQLPQVEAQAAQARGRVVAGTTVSVDIPATRSAFKARQARVYLPPAWFAATAPRLPALILLPGEPGGPTDWTDDGDADAVANDFAANHHGVAPIIVMPDATGQEDADTECINSIRFGQAETYLTVDVPAYVRAAFRAASGPGSLAIAGASAGGTCATVLSLRHPTIFQAFASFSGFATPTYKDDTVAESLDPLYDGSEAAFLAHDPLTLLSTNRYPLTAAWFEAGTGDDEPWVDARTLAAASRRAGMAEVCLVGVSGGHTWKVWQESFEAALPWVSWRLGLVAQPPPTPAQCSAATTR
jgi:S-formylglutathione hydrolase FrmB